MPTLDDVYRKFGEASEAAQLLETELGTMLLTVGAVVLPHRLILRPGRRLKIMSRLYSFQDDRISVAQAIVPPVAVSI